MNRTHTPEDVEKIQSGWRKRQIETGTMKWLKDLEKFNEETENDTR